MQDERAPDDDAGIPQGNLSPFSTRPQTNAIPTTQPATAQQLSDVEERMSAFERSMIRLTLAGLLITVVTGGFIGLQWWEMRSGSVDTHALAEAAKAQAETAKAIAESAKAQADNSAQQIIVAGKQAKAADGSVKAIQRQMRQDQRAWLDIVIGNFQWGLNVPVSVPVIITNMGKTPARKFRVAVVVEVLTIDKSPDLSDKLNTPAVTETAGIMTPHSVSTLKGQTFLVDPSDKSKAIPWNLGETDKLNLEIGKTYWVAHGMLWYDDIFKTSHWRKFCTFGSPKPGILMPTGACSEYNNVDNN